MMKAVDLPMLAMDRFNAGALDEAIAICQVVLAKVPDHPKCHQILGLIALQRGQAEPAEAHFSAAVRNASEPDAVLHGGWAAALHWVGRSVEAAREARKTLVLDPTSSFGSRLLAELATRLPKSPEGRSRLKRIRALAPGDEWSVQMLGLLGPERKQAPPALEPSPVPVGDDDEAGDFAALQEAISTNRVSLTIDVSMLSKRSCPLALAYLKRRVIFGYVAASLAAPVIVWPYGVALAAILGASHLLFVRSWLNRILQRRAHALLIADLERFKRMWRFGGVSLRGTGRPDVVFLATKDDWRAAIRGMESTSVNCSAEIR